MIRKDENIVKKISEGGIDLKMIEKRIGEEIIEMNFFDTLDMEKLQESMDSFKHLTGLDVEITFLDGTIVVDTKGDNLCRKFHRQHRELSRNCFDKENNQALKFDNSEEKRIKIPGTRYPVYQCNNLIPYSVVPVKLRDHHVANLTLRNFFIEGYLEPYRLIKQGEKAGFSDEEYFEVIKQYEVLSPVKFNETMRYLTYLSELMSEVAYSKRTDGELKKVLSEAFEELSAAYEELVASEEELRDQIRIIEEKDRALQSTENAFQQLYDKMSEGLAVHEMIFDEKGKAKDYRFLKVNKSFEGLTGLKKEEIIGKTVRQLLPETEDYWIEAYGHVVKNNEVMEVENYSKEIKEYFNVKAYKLEGNQFATLIRNVTKQKTEALKDKKNWFQTVASLGELVERRDAYTAGHQKNVAIISKKIGEKLGLSENRLEGLYLAGLLHDIGKTQIPSEILTKPTKLLPEEFNLIKIHSKSGYDVLKNIDFPWNIAKFVLQHHEKLDGSGYPDGLKGEEILLESRILTLADVVEAISSHRPYRPALGMDYALEEIEKGKGIQYDPDVVEAFIDLYHHNKLPNSVFR